MACIAPDNLTDTLALHETVTYFTIPCWVNVAVFVYPPVNELTYPRAGIGVTSAPESISNAVGITVTGSEIFELLVRYMRDLVDGNIGILLALETLFEVIIRIIMVIESKRTSCREVPSHIRLRLVVGSVLRIQFP